MALVYHNPREYKTIFPGRREKHEGIFPFGAEYKKVSAPACDRAVGKVCRTISLKSQIQMQKGH